MEILENAFAGNCTENCGGHWLNMVLDILWRILSAPKTNYAQDIVFDKDTPIFCTSKSEILSIKNGVLDKWPQSGPDGFILETSVHCVEKHTLDQCWVIL